MEITEIGLLAIKAESAYGTDPTPAVGANLIPAARDSITYEVASTAVKRKALDGTMGMQPGFNALPNVTLKFRYELRGNRTDGVVADISAGASAQKVEIDPILQAANLDPTYTAETTVGGRNGYVIYKPKSYTTEGPSVTAYWWSALKLHKLFGGKVDLSMTWEAGQMVLMDVTIRGKYGVPVDTTFPTSGLSFLATKPQMFEGGAVGLDVTAPPFRRAQFDLANQIAMRANPVDSTGVAGFIITGRDSKGSVNFESVTEAAHPIFADWLVSKRKPFGVTMPSGSGVSGNRLDLQVGAELKSINYQNQDGQRVHDAQFDIVQTAFGDNTDLALKFY
jgi:hypothetical protein